VPPIAPPNAVYARPTNDKELACGVFAKVRCGFDVPVLRVAVPPTTFGERRLEVVAAFIASPLLRYFHRQLRLPNDTAVQGGAGEGAERHAARPTATAGWAALRGSVEKRAPGYRTKWCSRTRRRPSVNS